MPGRILLYTICVACLGPVFLFAQDSSLQAPPPKWNLQTCLDYAVKNNYELNSLRLTRQTSEQSLLLSKAAVLPGVSGNLLNTYTHSKNTNPVVGGFQTQGHFASNYSVSSSWTVFNGGYLKDDIKQKDAEVKSAGLSIVQQENDITLQVTQAYLNILLAKENIVYEQDLLQTSQAQLKQGQQQFDAGSIAKKDLVTLQAQLATDKYNLVTGQNAERQNILNLKQLLLLPSDFAFDIAEPDTLIARALVPSLEEVQKAALDSRPEVKNSELGVQIAQLDLAKARAEYLPTATVGAVVASGYSDNQSDAYLEQLDNNFYQQIGLTLSIPIFTKRVTRTNVEKSKIEVAQASLTVKNTKTVLSQTVEQAYINVLNAQAQYDASVEELKATQESYRIAIEQLKVGAVNTVDLLLQKNLYVQALQNYTQAKYSSALNIRIYDFYRGIPIKF
ncbi:MAG: TolC family protein [Bacteroidota bacterium]|nr:TolC family protein [Bacteroidota bacterium]